MKAILVIDVPESEINKPCMVKWLNGTEWVAVGKSRPMPEPKDVEVNEIEDIMHIKYSIEDIYTNKYIANIQLATDKLISLGWNACIDMITGEEE